MVRSFKNLTVVEVQHTTFAWGTTHMLANFLRQECVLFVYLQHPFEHFRFYGARISIYGRGKEVRTRALSSTRAPIPLLLLRDLAVTLLYVVSMKRRFHLYIGADALNAFSGIVLRSVGLVSRNLFYAIDWSPRRFDNTVANRIYHIVQRWVARRSDFVWCASDRIELAFARLGVGRSKLSVVPPGVDLNRAKGYAGSPPVDRGCMIFIGSLTQEKGLQLVVDAMASIREVCPSATLKIIGTGPYEKVLRQKASLLEPTVVEFLGRLGNQDEALRVIAQSAIGLATYHPNDRSYSGFAFPGKVIEYMACGLPVIATRTHEFMDRIEKSRAGILIDYDKSQFVNAAVSLMTNDVLYQQLRKNAIALASEFDYRAIFEKALARIWEGLE